MIEISEGEKATVAKSNEHLEYLKRMVSDGVVSKQLAWKAKSLWLAARYEVIGMPVPAAATFSGGPIEYHWTVGPHQMSVEIPENGPCHWTYRNKIDGELWGIETLIEDGLPPHLIDHLSRLVVGNC